MNNKGYILTFWLFLWTRFVKNSLIYKLLHNVYSFISNQWQSSRIAGFVRGSFLEGNSLKKSLFGKIFFWPFILLEAIQAKYAEKLLSIKERSLIIRISKYILHNFLALNLRFLGIFLFSATAVDLILSLILGGGLVLSLSAMAIGLALSFFDVNVTSLLENSLFVKLAGKCLDTEFNFNFFYITKCSGKARLFCAAGFGVATGLICGLVSPVLALLFAGGVLFLFLSLYKVEFAVLSTLFLAPLAPTMIVVGLCLLCLLSLVVKTVQTKKLALRYDGVGFLVLLMLIVYLIASLASFAPFKSIQIFAVYCAFMSFYFVVINTIRTKEQLFSALKVFTLSGTAVCLYGLLQYVLGASGAQAWIDENMFADIKMRIYSTLDNPNVLGEYILLALPMSIVLMWTSKKILPRLTYLGLTLIMGLALILTFSRGCWLGIMASASVFITFVSGKLWGLALIVLPLIPFVLPESIINRFTSIGDMTDSSTSYRVSIWMGTLLMLKDFWLSGIGLGSEAFTKVYPFYSYNMVVAQHPHNLFLHIITESGIVGIVVFTILLFTFFKTLASASRCQKSDRGLYVLIVGIASAVTGFLLQGMFDNCFYNYRVFMLFWVVVALGTAAFHIGKALLPHEEVPND